MESFDLTREILALRRQTDWQRGHIAKTLIKNPDLRVVLIALAAGGRLDRHQAPGPITIHALEGRLNVRVDGQPAELAPGQLLAIEAAVPHEVEAQEAAAVLLTIAWPEDSPTAA